MLRVLINQVLSATLLTGISQVISVLSLLYVTTQVPLDVIGRYGSIISLSLILSSLVSLRLDLLIVKSDEQHADNIFSYCTKVAHLVALIITAVALILGNADLLIAALATPLIALHQIFTSHALKHNNKYYYYTFRVVPGIFTGILMVLSLTFKFDLIWAFIVPRIFLVYSYILLKQSAMNRMQEDLTALTCDLGFIFTHAPLSFMSIFTINFATLLISDTVSLSAAGLYFLCLRVFIAPTNLINSVLTTHIVDTAQKNRSEHIFLEYRDMAVKFGSIVAILVTLLTSFINITISGINSSIIGLNILWSTCILVILPFNQILLVQNNHIKIVLSGMLVNIARLILILSLTQIFDESDNMISLIFGTMSVTILLNVVILWRYYLRKWSIVFVCSILMSTFSIIWIN